MTVTMILNHSVLLVQAMVTSPVVSALALMDGQEMTAPVRQLPVIKDLIIRNAVGEDHVCVVSVCAANPTPLTLV